MDFGINIKISAPERMAAYQPRTFTQPPAPMDIRTMFENSVNSWVFTPEQRSIANQVLAHPARAELEASYEKKRYMDRDVFDAFVSKYEITP